MMLRHLKQDAEAFRLRQAIAAVISQGDYLTVDLGGSATTEEFTREVIANLGRSKKKSKSSAKKSTKKKSASKKPAAKKASAKKPAAKRTAAKKSSTKGLKGAAKPRRKAAAKR